MNYNFNEITNRKGTEALKIEALKTLWNREDLLPLWVADMDFKSPECITNAIKKRLENGIFGYTSAPEEWYKAIIKWHKKRNQWDISQKMISFLPGVVPGLAFAVNCFTQPKDKVLIMPPVYYPFRLAIENNGRRVVNCPLDLENGEYKIDFERFKKHIKGCKLLLLCNPHNPGGKVWAKEELIKIAEICKENKTLVISDEIHSDLTFQPYKHYVFSTVCNAAKENSIILNAPSKAFNLAGFCTSYSVIENPEIREKYTTFIENTLTINPNVFSYITTTVAYNQGEEWLNQVLDYIKENIIFLDDFLKKNTPKIKAIIPQASYLVFLDCRDLDLTQDDLIKFFVEEARLALNDGAAYGTPGKGFMRINLACPRPVLEKALKQIKAAYHKIA